MSATPHTPVPPSLDAPLPMTLPRLAEKKRLGEPIVMVTAYDYPSAQVAQEAGVDVVLVGDSGAMTVLGYPSTVPVSTDEMLMLASAVLMTLVILSPLPDSDAVKVSKLSSVSFTATSLSEITLSTLRSALRIFSCTSSRASGSAVRTGTPSSSRGTAGAAIEPPVSEIAAIPVNP